MVCKRPHLEGQERLLLVRASYTRLDILLTCSLDDSSTATHSCFNAFSRVDVRVDVKIPGGVNAYVIDLRGERCVLLFLFPFLHSMRPLRQTSSYPRHLARNIPLRHPSRYPVR